MGGTGGIGRTGGMGRTGKPVTGSVPPLLPFLPLFFSLLFLSTVFAQNPTFRTASSELVVLPIVVTDRHGQLISDLERDHFAVFDNGRRMDVELFSNEDTPVTVGLVIDSSSSMRAKLAEVIAATLKFASSSHPDDELFVIRFNDDARHAVPDRRFLLASDRGALESAMTALVPEGRTALYDALVAGLDHLNAGTRARKILVVMSDGGDNASRATLDSVLARARASNVTIYTIGIYDRDDPDKNPGALKSLAETTGGERFLPRSTGTLILTCERIAREIRSGYTLGYTPPDRDGNYHRVRVVVDAPDRKLNVRTRPGYFAAGSKAP
jgi:Ca-activated chloride channel family protein